jgi:hypothetical protein
LAPVWPRALPSVRLRYHTPGMRKKKARTSFLKKRSKKLLLVWAEPIRAGRSQMFKSFLLLFFKKEVLPS